VTRRLAGPRAVVAVALALCLTPLLASSAAAASDPPGDVGRCPHVPAGGREGSPPDLVEAVGEIVELGTSVRFSLRFAEPLTVPDPDGHPFRVEIVLLDPDVPGVDGGVYRGVNRLLRYDAVPDPVTTTLLLPEAGQSRFIPPAIAGDTLVFQVPGRTLVADEDETGTSPGVEQLRWGVIVRDEDACDLLGEGRAIRRLAVPDDAPVAASAAASAADDPHGAGVPGWALLGGATLALGFGGVLLWRFVRGGR